jgi:sialic acid synthase SpsE
MAEFMIGKRFVGDGHPPVFWPDIDVYFKRDVPLAIDMVRSMKAAGVEVIKGAVLHRADLCLDQNCPTEYFVPGRGVVTESYRKIVERHVVDLESLRRIFGEVRDLGLDLVLSVYDDEGLAFAEEMGAAAIKIPSSNIVHAPLIRAAASARRPLVIDTGRSSIAEIDRAMCWAMDAGAQEILVQHSPPGPPAHPVQFNMRMMSELGRRFGVPYGLSDHFAGGEMVSIAVAMGASVLEKGVCVDGATADIDLAHALPLSRVPLLLETMVLAYESLGATIRADPETCSRPRDRMGLVAARDLHPGDRLDLACVRFAFPATGIPVEDWDMVVGGVLVTSVAAGRSISSGDLEQDD